MITVRWAFNGLCIAGWSRSLSLPVLYLSRIEVHPECYIEASLSRRRRIAIGLN
jgi:hypothetical protein